MKYAMPSIYQKIGLSILVCLLPTLMTLTLVHYSLDSDITNFVPDTWNDQTGYWIMMNSMHHVGFKGGLYSLFENTAAIEEIRFSVHGPGYFMTVWPFTLLFGWNATTPIYLNFLFIGLAILIFLWQIRGTFQQILLTGAVVATFHPLLLYLSTSSQESFHQAIAIVLAGLLGYQLQGGQFAKWQKVLIIILLLWVSYIRSSWLIVLLPMLFLFAEKRGFFAGLKAISFTAVATIAILVIFANTSTPGGHSVIGRSENLVESPIEGLRGFSEELQSNIQTSLQVSITRQTSLASLYGQMVFFLAAMVVLAVRAKFKPHQGVPPTQLFESSFHWYSLIAVMVSSYLLYLPSGYYRIWGLMFLLSVMVAISQRHWVLVAGVVVIHLITMTVFLDQEYHDWYSNFHYDLDTLRADQTVVADYITYQADADSFWCNSLYLPVQYYNIRTLAIPPGIGISTLLPAKEMRSFYIVAENHQQFTLWAETYRLTDWAYAGTLPIGELYYNYSSPCQHYSEASCVNVGLCDNWCFSEGPWSDGRCGDNMTAESQHYWKCGWLLARYERGEILQAELETQACMPLITDKS